MTKILAHIVLHNSPRSALVTIESLLAQELAKDFQLQISVADNSSSNDTFARVQAAFADVVDCYRHDHNIGFAAAQNQAARRCLEEGFDFLFMVNPDSRFERTALAELIAAAEKETDLAGATPLLYRADDNLIPVQPREIDAAGMVMTRTLRHLDRSGPVTDLPSFTQVERVFGGTGAALLIKRAAIERLTLELAEGNNALFSVYPQLKSGFSGRQQLFDEAFFAYREDADLSWRAQILGLGFVFVPAAVGYHIRHVVPERRSTLSPDVNCWSVRNRFLMQVNNFAVAGLAHCILPGLVIRNLVVIAGVLLREWSSLPGLVQFLRLLPRALARRRALFSRADAHPERIGHWFR